MTVRIINRFFGNPVTEPNQIAAALPRDYTLDDWIDQHEKLVFFSKMKYGIYKGQYECSLQTIHVNAEVKTNGYGRTTGDAFYDALRTMEDAIGRQGRK